MTSNTQKQDNIKGGEDSHKLTSFAPVKDFHNSSGNKKISLFSKIFGGGEDTPVVASVSTVQQSNDTSIKETPESPSSLLSKLAPTLSSPKGNKSPVTTPVPVNKAGSKDGPAKRSIAKEIPRSNSDSASMNMFRASQRNSLSSIEDLRLSDGDTNSKLRREASFRRDSKDFWMPDHEVMFCYDCQAPFSTFKRRHHCRICGQIFCWKCTQNTIKLLENPVRVCNACFRTQSKVLQESPSSPAKSPSNRRSTSTDDVTRTPKPERNNEKFLSKNYEPVQDMHLSKELLPTMPYDYGGINKSDQSSEAIHEKEESEDKIGVNNIIETQTILADSPAVTSPISAADALSIKVDAEFKKFKEEDGTNEPIYSVKVIPRKLRKAKTFDTIPFPLIKEKLADKPTANSIDLIANKKQLLKSSDERLTKIILQLLAMDNLDSTWLDTIKKFATRVCDSLRPQIRQGDYLDIRNYAKVKIIPEGSREECIFIDGVVFTKNIGHKKLKSRINNAKVLLLSGGLEFQRENRFLQLDDLLSQERSHLKFLVARIASLNPDLVLVGKTVSRIAQEYLVSENITFALNVKNEVLKRISRATGADILNSPTDILDPHLGTVENFYVNSYKGDWGVKPLMFFDGTPKDLCSSIILRGDTINVLKKVKKILLFAVYTAYNLYLESSLLLDINCSFPNSNSSITSNKDILSCSLNIEFPAASTSNNNNMELLASLYDEQYSRSSNPFSIVANNQFITNAVPTKSLEDNSSEEPESAPNQQRRESAITAPSSIYQFQKILYLHSLCNNTTSQHCIPYEFNTIEYYQQNDLTLGQFLEQHCFDLTYKCKARGCNRTILEHERSFVHHNGRINITVTEALRSPSSGQLDSPTAPLSGKSILVCGSCKVCGKNTPHTFLSEASWNYSFGKFLELTFYGTSAICSLPSCQHAFNKDHTLFFYFGSLVAELEYEQIDVLDVAVPNFTIIYNPVMLEKARDLETDLLISTSQQLYDVTIKKLSQIEYELTKGIKDTQIQQLITSCRNEKSMFLEEIEVAKKTNGQFNSSKRKLFANAITWNSTLYEQTLRIQNNKKVNHTRNPSWKGSGDDLIKIDINNNNTSSNSNANSISGTPNSVSQNNYLSSNDDFKGNVFDDSPISTIPSTSTTIALPSSTTTTASDNKQISTVPNSSTPTISTTIINAFTNLMGNSTSIAQPLLFPSGYNDTVVLVYEDEPSSIIAHTLTSKEYTEKLGVKEKQELNAPSLEALDDWKSMLVSKESSDITSKFEYDKYNYKVQISCTSYCAKQFHALRALSLSEEQYILSLSRCKSWDASGGKSGSDFSKTSDNRFVLKAISKIELEGFLQHATLYFEYLSNALFHQVPTILGKIYGVYTVKLKNPGKSVTQYLVVMENLFYNRSIIKTYDLKGSKRSRYVSPDQSEVLLDENLLEVMFTSPVCVDQLSKVKLQASIWNDTLFLSSLGVMDYSLLIGIDNTTKKLVVGIIDYIRTYTWDKHFETWVKSTGIIGGRGQDPTVISPLQYKQRFRDAMNFYFLVVPTKHTLYVKKQNDVV